MSDGASNEHDIWRDLGDRDREALRARMTSRRIGRGEILVRAGDTSESFFVVDFGLFEVLGNDSERVVAEIGPGQLVGEIGFFARGLRTASVVAARDSQVLEIDRASFEDLAATRPGLREMVAQSLAQRLATLASIIHRTDGIAAVRRLRIATILPAGNGDLPAALLASLRRAFDRNDTARLVCAADCPPVSDDPEAARFQLSEWLADIERDHAFVLCVAGTSRDAWTETALRSADQLVLTARDNSGAPNEAERLALELVPPARRRLLRLHAARGGLVEPAVGLLQERDVFMIHHAVASDADDIARLLRFLRGTARGYVAGGGGGFGPAHVGIVRAFRDAGIRFDLFGGASVGAAITAPLAILFEPEDLQESIAEMFVRRGALSKYTFPRYSLIDHTPIDACLREGYGEAAVEDAWLPWFVVALDVSSYEKKIFRSGPIWRAVRASVSVPGALPPYFDGAGHMLLDGGLVDNVPVEPMKAIKSGPNVVVDLRPRIERTYDVDYADIPGRRDLLLRMANPFRRRALPPAPGPATVIQLSMFGGLDEPYTIDPGNDLLLKPPAFPGSSFLDWSRHREVSAAAYEWACGELESRDRAGDPALAALRRSD